MKHVVRRRRVTVLLYPGCIFLEIAPALELLAIVLYDAG